MNSYGQYHCAKCNYTTLEKYDWNKHILTNKHLGVNMFSCVQCNYTTTKKCNYEKHLNTKKHKLKHNNSNSNIVNNTKTTNSIYECNMCHKKYKHRQSLFKHMKKCEARVCNNYICEEQKVQINNITTNNITNNNQISINNKISINLYLNKECKDAMNLEDFIKKIEVSFNNLDYSKDNGFVKGIANIVQEQLKDLTPKERPIHCSDKKRLKFYVKEQNKWEKDENHINLEKTINEIKMQQLRKLFEWEQQNPEFGKDPILLNNWQKMVDSTMCGCTDEEIKKNDKKSKWQ